MGDIVEDDGPESGIFPGIETTRGAASGERQAASDAERIAALRQLVAEALPYVARHAEIDVATSWLQRADALGCRQR